MVSQGFLCEKDGILPDWPYVWESDDAIPRTPDYEEFSSNECDSNFDEGLMYEASGCPTIRRLQAVALRHKYRAYGLELDLDRERAFVARLEVQSQEDAQRLFELSTYSVTLVSERDKARKLARWWKLCACMLCLIVSAFVLGSMVDSGLMVEIMRLRAMLACYV